MLEQFKLVTGMWNYYSRIHIDTYKHMLSSFLTVKTEMKRGIGHFREFPSVSCTEKCLSSQVSRTLSPTFKGVMGKRSNREKK